MKCFGWQRRINPPLRGAKGVSLISKSNTVQRGSKKDTMNLIEFADSKHTPLKGGMFVSILTILLILTSISAFAQENASKILSKVRATYDALESLSADFEKEYTWALAGETQALSGKLYLKKGDRYRIETELQTIVTDGKTVWTYSPEKAQVFVDNMEKSKENPLPRDLLVKYTSDFKSQYLRSDKLGEVECHVLLLTAREEEAFAQSVTVWVDKKTFVALQIEQRDLNDNITVYRLQNLTLNAKLADQLFTFTAPNDTEVIDLRK